MRCVVLDTNVLVSGLLVPGSIPAEILRQFRDGQWQLAVSPAILEEYGRVLRRRRFGFRAKDVLAVLQEIEVRARVVIPARRFHAVREDPAGDEFLDTAVEAKADALISGDRHLWTLGNFHGVAVVTPARFLSGQ